VEAALLRLAGRELVLRLDRRPGEREERWTHLLAETPPAHAQEADAETRAPASLERRVAQLEDRLDELERLLAERDLLERG
jgi:uncharacterized protein